MTLSSPPSIVTRKCLSQSSNGGVKRPTGSEEPIGFGACCTNMMFRRVFLFSAAVLTLLPLIGCTKKGTATGPIANSTAAETIRKALIADTSSGENTSDSEEEAPEVVTGWGTLKGRVVFAGDAPSPRAIIPDKDVEFCSKNGLFDESVQVDTEGGLANMLIYLNEKKPPIHPSLAKSNGEEVQLDNKGCRFEPHILLVQTGQTLLIKNSDTVGHNTNGSLTKNPSFNGTLPAGSTIKKVFKKGESAPGTVTCSMHPWMKGRIFIRDNPYMVLTASDGSFEIPKLPAGTYEFGFWHEAGGNLRGLKLSDGTTSSKGRIKLTIPADGMLDLGNIKIGPSQIKVK